MRTVHHKLDSSCHHTPLRQLVSKVLSNSGQVDFSCRLRSAKAQDVRQDCQLNELDKWSLQLSQSQASQQLQAHTNLLGCSPPAYRSACNHELDTWSGFVLQPWLTCDWWVVLNYLAAASCPRQPWPFCDWRVVLVPVAAAICREACISLNSTSFSTRGAHQSV